MYIQHVYLKNCIFMENERDFFFIDACCQYYYLDTKINNPLKFFSLWYYFKTCFQKSINHFKAYCLLFPLSADKNHKKNNMITSIA